MELEAQAAERSAVPELVPRAAESVGSDSVRVVVDRRQMVARRDEATRERRVELRRNVRIDVGAERPARQLARVRPLVANRNVERIEALYVEVGNLVDAELVLVFATREETQRLLSAGDLCPAFAS